ncbi:FAD-binding oxidoreductase [Lacibacterium aquatile]|uniref:FAD-binding oxidoreductase n=1 Tax=Lacibacterium aquatile TaxID=1168082 RepID=A0ABW5DWH9_9PROT
MKELIFEGRPVAALDGETVLEALLRDGIAIAHQCRKGVCLSCAVHSIGRCPPPMEAQMSLPLAARNQNQALACQWRIGSDPIEIAGAGTINRPQSGRIEQIELLSPSVARVLLSVPRSFEAEAGQYVVVRRRDGLERPYSIASLPTQARPFLELHVRRYDGGLMSPWLCNRETAGKRVDLFGPYGATTYRPDKPEANLLLIGTGTGLAPLYGILQDALAQGHQGQIALYHGSRARDGLYLDAELSELATESPNFSYTACLSDRENTSTGTAIGRAHEIAFMRHADLKGWRVYLCGLPAMVASARRSAFLAGAAFDDIFIDPFHPAPATA